MKKLFNRRAEGYIDTVVAIIGVALLVSVLSLTQIQFYPPMALTLVYTFLTIRMEESTVLEFIFRAARFFLTTQQ